MAKKKRGRPPKKKTQTKTKAQSQSQPEAEETQDEQQETEHEVQEPQTERERVAASRFDRVIGKKKGPTGKTRAVVMTKEASEIVDSNRKGGESKYFNKDCIHKPRG